MSRKLLIVSLLVVLVGCGALAGVVRTAADTAVGKALAGGAADGQRVTAVCVGLNIGSCRTNQDSTERAAGDDGNVLPWLVVAVLCPVLLGGVIWLGREIED
jgi:hypothetical protein